MKDGVIPAGLITLPLERISPSRFRAVRECALREVWTAARNPGLLPKPAAAHVGTIIHKLFEKAAKYQLAGVNKRRVESIWDELEAILEADFSKSWVERANVPLRKHVFRYSVRKLRAIHSAFLLAEEVGTPPLPSPSGPEVSLRGAETWLEAPDGTVGGFVDRIISDSSGVTLRDYKSGHVFDGPTGEVREEYQTQLKLYAALFEKSRHEWPVRLEVAPPCGPTVEVKFAVEECDALLQEASQTLNEVNNAVSANQIDALATPSPRICRFCSFRPMCSAYRAARESGATADSDWPLDAWGEFIQSEIMGDGLMSMTLLAESHQSAEITIKRITPLESRHPALSHLALGQKISFFTLRQSRRTNDYFEGSATTIYSKDA